MDVIFVYILCFCLFKCVFICSFDHLLILLMKREVDFLLQFLLHIFIYQDIHFFVNLFILPFIYLIYLLVIHSIIFSAICLFTYLSSFLLRISDSITCEQFHWLWTALYISAFSGEVMKSSSLINDVVWVTGFYMHARSMTPLPQWAFILLIKRLVLLLISLLLFST